MGIKRIYAIWSGVFFGFPLVVQSFWDVPVAPLIIALVLGIVFLALSTEDKGTRR